MPSPIPEVLSLVPSGPKRGADRQADSPKSSPDRSETGDKADFADFFAQSDSVQISVDEASEALATLDNPDDVTGEAEVEPEAPESIVESDADTVPTDVDLIDAGGTEGPILSKSGDAASFDMPSTASAISATHGPLEPGFGTALEGAQMSGEIALALPEIRLSSVERRADQMDQARVVAAAPLQVPGVTQAVSAKPGPILPVLTTGGAALTGPKPSGIGDVTEDALISLSLSQTGAMHGDGVQPPIASGIALAKPVAVQTASVVQWAVAGVPDRQLSASVSPDVLPMDAENLAIGETHGQPSRGDVAAVSLAGPVAQPRAELARSIAAQIAETSVHSRGRSLDISLHPEELGKVRISVTQTDAGYAITIQADRQETADLMRRYQHLLESEMRGAGFAKVDVDVSGQGGRSPSFGTSQSEADTSGGTQEIARETPQAARPKPQVSGLDVRV